MSNASGVTRRKFIVGAGALAALPWLSLQAQDGNNAAVAEDAYVWGFPLVLTSRYRSLAGSYPVNQFTVSTRLSEPGDRVAAPNVDTLYGFAFLDLTKEPLILHVPDTSDRYYSIHLIDAYQNGFAYVGRRATGTRAGEYAIAAPGWKGTLPPGVTRIDSPTSHVLALTRTLVRSERDLPEAQAIQRKYTLRPLSGYSQPGLVPLDTAAALNVFPFINLFESGAKVFEELNAALAVDPPSPHEKAPFKEFAKLGISPRNRPPVFALDADSLDDAAATAYRKIRDANFSTDANGWKVNYRVTNFISDSLLRASVNRIGPGVHVAQEALYFVSRADSDGQIFSGESSYRLRFPERSLPPVDGFWSLIVYGGDNGLVKNPIQRYAITDRTEGLVKSSDGSLELSIQTEQPLSGAANWLPVPRGPFSLVLRAYQPRQELLNGSYKPPVLQRVTAQG